MQHYLHKYTKNLYNNNHYTSSNKPFDFKIDKDFERETNYDEIITLKDIIYVKKHKGQIKTDNIHKIFYTVCSKGLFDIVKWMYRNIPGMQTYTYKNKALQMASKNNHVKIIKWLLKKFPKIDVYKNDANFLAYAYKNGNTKLIKWIKNKYPKIHGYLNKPFVFEFACESGNMKLIELIFVKAKSYYENNDAIYEAIINICKSGNIKTLKKFIKKYFISTDDHCATYNDVIFNMAFDILSVDNVCFVKWFIRNYHRFVRKVMTESNHDIIDQFYELGKYEIANYLFKKFYKYDMSYNKIYEYLLYICGKGDFKMVKWVMKKFNDYKYKQYDECTDEEINYELFSLSVSSQNISLAKWLLKHYPYMSKYKNNALALACKNGSFKMIKWVIKKFPDVNVCYNHNHIIIKAVMNNQWKVVKWLLKNYPTINVYINDNKIFYEAAKSGNLPMVKWLLKNYIMIDVYTDIIRPLQVTYYKNNRTFRWLLKNKLKHNLHPSIKILIKNGKIKF